MDNETSKLLIDVVANSIQQLSNKVDESKNTVTRIELCSQKVKEDVQSVVHTLSNVEKSQLALMKAIEQLDAKISTQIIPPAEISIGKKQLTDIAEHVSDVKGLVSLIKNPLTIVIAFITFLVALAGVVDVISKISDARKESQKTQQVTPGQK